MRYLTAADLPLLVRVACHAAEARGEDFFNWKEPPRVSDTGVITHVTSSGSEREVTAEEAFQIWKSKLDCAYAQRFLLTLAFVVAAVQRGMHVALIRFTDKRDETAFDPHGWVTFSFDEFTNFHVSSEDLPAKDLEAAGLINVLETGSDEARQHGYHGMTKLDRLFLPIEQLMS